MPRFTAGNGTSECGVAQAQGFRDGRWTVMAVWTLTLAPIEEAGYIDARPHIRQIDETLLQRAAGPYIGVNRYRNGSSAICPIHPQE